MYPEHLQKYIPPEFDLAKYDKAANMDLIHWMNNLIKRSSIFSCYQANDYSFDEYNLPHKAPLEDDLYNFPHGKLSPKESFEKELFENIAEGVIVDSSIHTFFDALFISETGDNLSTVKGMTYEDLFLLKAKYLTDERQEIYSNVEQSICPTVYESNLGELNNVIQCFDANGNIDSSWLKVDMNCSDSEITKAFSSWLKKTRTELDGQRKTKTRERKLNHFNQVTFRKWHDAKVLPYIDLVTWNFLKKNKVTSKILGEILFPDPRNLSDKAKIIEDTTRPYVSQLTSLSFKSRVISVLKDESRKKITKKSS